MAGILSRLPAIVSGALSSTFDDCTIERETMTADGRGGFEASTEANHDAKGLVLDYSDFARSASGGSIAASDRKVIILGHGLAITPRVGDLVTIGGARWRAISVSRDPAAATYEIQGRPS